MSEQTTEAAIAATNPQAPRLTPLNIDEVIVGETFTVLPSGRVTVCELTRRNGAVVIGESYVASAANFRPALGQAVAREEARRKVWQLEGYLLHEKLHGDAIEEQYSLWLGGRAGDGDGARDAG